MTSEDQSTRPERDQTPGGMEAVPDAVSEIRKLLEEQDLTLKDLLEATNEENFGPMSSAGFCIKNPCGVICNSCEEK